MDLIDICLQALSYEKQARYDLGEENENFEKYDNLYEFFATAKPILTTDAGHRMYQEKERYERVKDR